jgi:hypothetical protein
MPQLEEIDVVISLPIISSKNSTPMLCQSSYLHFRHF